MPRVFHFEIPSDDPAKSMAFYQDVFGWTFEAFGETEYWICKTGEEPEKGINGGLMKRRSPGQPMVNTILVDSVDDYCEKIVEAGGEVVVPKMAIGTIGHLSYFKDPDGHVLGVAELTSISH